MRVPRMTRGANAAAGIVWLAALLIFPARVASDSFSFPPTRAGEIARAYFQALNSGDPDKLRAFELTYRSAAALEKKSVEQRVAGKLAMHEQAGALTPAKIVAEKPHSLTVTAHAAKADVWLNCTITIEEAPPHKLISVAVMPGSAPEATAAYAQDWKDLANLLGQIKEKTGAPAVAAAIVQRGTITDIAVVGERWIGSGQPVDRDDAFHMGSVTKSMTATMIGALVQKQLLTWDMTVGEILVGMEMRDEYRGVTVEQLLQHRGGFPPYTNIGNEEEKRLASLPGTPTSQRELFVAEVLMKAPAQTPGTSMLYSNAGYAVAALIAERVSARSWEELMRTHVFEISGMKHAGFGWPSTPDHPNQPRGHFDENGTLRPQQFGEYELGPFIAPAGDVHCSIADLALYCTLHLRGLAGHDKDYLADIIQRLHTAPEALGDEMRYAAGWAVVNSPEVGEVHSHSGSAGTFFATVELYPEYEAAVVLATNADMGRGTTVSKEITDLVKQRIKEQ